MVKIRWTDRLLLALCGALGLLVSLALGALTLYRQSFAVSVAGYVVTLQDNWITVAVLAAIAFVLLCWAIRMLVFAFRQPPKVDKSSVSVQNTENGSVRVSVGAMDMLVKHAVQDTEGVVDVKTRIENHDDSITVNVDMTLESDVHIPNVTMLMQRNIKNFIEEYSGIAVREVRVMVQKIVEVTPQPPLQIEAPGKPAPEMIDQPDAIVPVSDEQEPTEGEAPQPANAYDQAPVEDYKAERESPDPEPEAEEALITDKDIW